jgi:lipid A 4'-phosphatase
LLVNTLLKPFWPRSGPAAVYEFKKTERFAPLWDWRGDCPRNCSFVSGEAAGAFWTMAPATLVPRPYRALALGMAIGFGSSIGILRMAFGGHFFTDVVFAGLLIYFVIWIAHGILYRWPRTADRFSDRAIGARLKRIREAFLVRLRA